MGVEVKVPTLGESVTEATVAKWFKAAGDAVARDEALLELETDKVTVEVNAPVAGALKSISAQEGAEVQVGALLGIIEEGAAGAAAPAPKAEKPAAQPEMKAASAPAPAPAAKPAPAPAPVAVRPAPAPTTAAIPAGAPASKPLSPAVRKLVEDNNLNAAQIPATGRDGRLTKGDVLDFVAKGGAPRTPAAAPARAAMPTVPGPAAPLPPRPEDPREERVRMTKLRRIIAARLKEAQNTAAMLTTWNEVDMGAAMDMRARYREAFEKKHGARLGFMSMFVRAACIGLREWPAVNGEIYGDEIIYKNYYNIGVAVGTPQGLVVPVLRDADKMSFAQIEGAIADFGRRARDGKLSIDEMTGGTFTISNGGVFGSLNSMPILNVPQSAILGMHKIDKRPVAVGDQVVIRPMMYLALSYDHRIVDGREAVSFLVRLKECIENPERILIDV
ncbi:MAG TPA: 2-oxoglutarate dehydrogenase complex dihydrolipoyllysine-residue succinyltransferase [Rhodospirillales bacterium]